MGRGPTKLKKASCLASKNAVVISEFLIVAPVMFILLFAIVEFCLWNMDRHLLTLASFEAAHDIVNSQADISKVCNRDLSAAGVGDEVSKVRDRVAWTMAKKMAAVSPAATDFLKNDYFSMKLPATEDAAPSLSGPGSIGKVLLFLLQRLPISYLLTSYTCRSLEGNVVQLEATYLRSPKMPLMRNTLWALYVIEKSAEKLNEAGLDGLVRLHMDGNFYDIEMQGQASATVREELKKFRNEVSSMQKEVAATQDYLSDNLLQFKIEIPPAVRERFGFVDGFFNKIKNHQWLNEIEGAAANFDNIVNEADFMSKVIYSVPQQFRLIPTKITVLVARDTTNRDQLTYRGNAMLIAPFNDRNGNWRDWAKRMAGSKPEEKLNGLQ